MTPLKEWPGFAKRGGYGVCAFSPGSLLNCNKRYVIKNTSVKFYAAIRMGFSKSFEMD